MRLLVPQLGDVAAAHLARLQLARDGVQLGHISAPAGDHAVDTVAAKAAQLLENARREHKKEKKKKEEELRKY